MSTSAFWHNVLEQDEKLLWTGRPKPRLHWRNWRLYAAAPMAAVGLIAAAGFILTTYGTGNDIWLLLIPAVLVLIPLRATVQQLRSYAASRYALTDKRALFFQVDKDQTRVKAHPLSAMYAPEHKSTLPQSIIFLKYTSGKEQRFGFDYVEEAEVLTAHLERMTDAMSLPSEAANGVD